MVQCGQFDLAVCARFLKRRKRKPFRPEKKSGRSVSISGGRGFRARSSFCGGESREALFHHLQPRASYLGTFHETFNATHPFRKIHDPAELRKVRLDFGILKVHLLAGVVHQPGVEGSTLDEGRDHIPIAIYLQDKCAMFILHR